jgi:flavin-dependent dehydrogenase
MAKIYDVIVVGAGPAGLMVAKAASAGGLNVALIERKTDISKIRRSDGGIIGINHYLFGEVVKFNRKTQTFVFPVNGFSLTYEGPWTQELYGFHVYSPNGNRFMLGDWKKLKKDPEKNSQGIGISKGLLLQGMLDEAMAQGVSFFPNTNVTKINTTAHGAGVTGNGEEYPGKFVIAADGVNSRIVRLLGLNKKRKFVGTSRNQTWLMEGINVPDYRPVKDDFM